jgi:hypothetical protein
MRRRIAELEGELMRRGGTIIIANNNGGDAHGVSTSCNGSSSGSGSGSDSSPGGNVAAAAAAAAAVRTELASEQRRHAQTRRQVSGASQCDAIPCRFVLLVCFVPHYVIPLRLAHTHSTHRRVDRYVMHRNVTPYRGL